VYIYGLWSTRQLEKQSEESIVEAKHYGSAKRWDAKSRALQIQEQSGVEDKLMKQQKRRKIKGREGAQS